MYGFRDHWKKIWRYAIISLLCLLLGVSLLILLIRKSEVLRDLGLVGNMYYIVLLPLGLSVAAFLFGVLRSYARYRGRQLGGTLELSGPIVAFAFVVVGGFILPKPQGDSFSLTVYVHGEEGIQDVVLRNSGIVVLTLGGKPERARIGENGEANFVEIPGTFRGQEVFVRVESDRFETIEPDRKRRIEGNSLYLPVRYKDIRFAGIVMDENLRSIPGAIVQFFGGSVRTDSLGHFTFTLPGKLANDNIEIKVEMEGYKPWLGRLIGNSDGVEIILYRRK